MPSTSPSAPSVRRISRRTLGAAGGIAAAGTVLGAGPADAGTRYRPATYSATQIVDPATLHALNRFTYGWTPRLGSQVRSAGGFGPWFDAQLTDTAEDPHYRETSRWWSSVTAPASTIGDRHDEGTEPLWVVDGNYQRWALVRRIGARNQVREQLTELWEHHLHVPADGSRTAMFRSEYGRLLHAGALGRFSDLLHTAITHPAMGLYLDNATSTAKAPNENLGRELLELHTVGVGNFTEDDVKASARILTGYRVDAWKTWDVFYDPAAHAVGPVKVLGFTDANTNPDGRGVVRRYTDYLARHPQTAQRIARKLAVRFVADDPPASLVNRLAATYLNHDTEIRPVLRALVASDEFKTARGTKVRTPSDDVVATYRALDVKIEAPTGEESAANAIVWQCSNLGMPPFGWPRPDGLPDTAASWATGPRFLASLDLHYTLSGGWWPTRDAQHRSPRSRLPLTRTRRSVRFDILVDHLARTLTGQKSTARLLRVCCQATGCLPGEKITASHPLASWMMPRLLTVFLDSPDHMSR